MTASLIDSVPFWLGVYATLLSTTVALLTLYGEIFQRVGVRASEDFLVVRNGRPTVMDRIAVEQQGIAPAAARPILTIAVRNRGRRPVQIQTLNKITWSTGVRVIFTTDVFGALPTVIEAGHTHNFHEGVTGVYQHGTVVPLTGFYAVDGAGRVHPLRQRWVWWLVVVYQRLAWWLVLFNWWFVGLYRRVLAAIGSAVMLLIAWAGTKRR